MAAGIGLNALQAGLRDVILPTLQVGIPMKALLPVAILALQLQVGSATAATCLDDVASFALRICGDIANTGTSTVVDANGNVDAGISNIIRKVVGGASTSINGHVLYDTYVGVARDQLAGVNFNVIDCRQKMVGIAVLQVCQAPAPVTPAKTYRVCYGEYERACQAHDIYDYCYTDDHKWANAHCSTHKVVDVNTYGGNKCGYRIFDVVCDNPH